MNTLESIRRDVNKAVGKLTRLRNREEKNIDANNLSINYLTAKNAESFLVLSEADRMRQQLEGLVGKES